MPGLLPLAAAVLLAAALRRREAAREGGLDGRESVLAAATLLGLAGVAGAEILGLLYALTPAAAAGFWAVLAAAAGALALRRAPANPRRAPETPARDPGDRALWIGLAALAAAVGIVAVAAAPNNWDSLTYHLPRVMHWIQDRGLEPYPTPVLRQLTLPPGAELLLTHLRLLAGSDRPLALLQFAAWLGCFVAASAVAGRLGAGRVGRLAAAIFAATLPMAILQGSSTQNDLVVSFWSLTFVAFALRLRAAPIRALDVFLTGASLGLALLTKATASLFCFPFAVWLAVSLFRRSRARAAAPLLAIAAVVLAVNVGYFSRNVSLFGSPFGEGYGAVSETRSPGAIASGVLRNAALHFAAPSSGWNRAVERAVGGLLSALGIDPNDPRTTWKGAEFHVPPALRGSERPDEEETVYLMLHEDHAGNPLHFLILAAALVAAAAGRRRHPDAARYLAAVAAGGFLFCAVLKWQPWNARLQLPLFLLAAPAAAAALAADESPAWTRRVAALLLLLSPPWALLNATRPLVGPESVLRVPRLDQYFVSRPGLERPLLSAAGRAMEPRCAAVGLEIGPDDPEYLVWVAFAQTGPLPRLEHLAVGNRSGALAGRAPFSTFRPCAAIALVPREAPASVGAVFAEDWAGGRVDVRRP